VKLALPGAGVMEQAMVPQPGDNFLRHIGFQECDRDQLILDVLGDVIGRLSMVVLAVDMTADRMLRDRI
jgi:hypothetical protein